MVPIAFTMLAPCLTVTRWKRHALASRQSQRPHAAHLLRSHPTRAGGSLTPATPSTRMTRRKPAAAALSHSRRKRSWSRLTSAASSSTCCLVSTLTFEPSAM